jgi:hypothetical protein
MRRPYAIGLLLFLILAAAGALGYAAFQPDEMPADLVAMDRFLRDQAPPADHLFVGVDGASLDMPAGAWKRFGAPRWLPQSAALPLPREGTALYVYPDSSPAPTWIMGYISPTRRFEGPAGPDGVPRYVAFLVPAAQRRTPAHALNADFSGQLTLVDATPGTGTSGEPLPLRLAWLVNQRPTANFQPDALLVDAWNDPWSARTLALYPASQWRVGDVIVAETSLPVPAGAPPGFYRLQLGFSDPDAGQALGRLDDVGRYAGQRVELPQIPILPGRPPLRLPLPTHILNAAVTDNLSLLGLDELPERAEPGEEVTVALWWLAQAQLPAFLVRLELIRPDGTGRILTTGAPVHDTFPFTAWTAPLMMIDRRPLTIPLDFADGDYRLVVRVLSDTDEAIFHADLGTLRVADTPRSFTRPDLTFPASAHFGGEIRFLGYDLTALPEERRYVLRVGWQADQAPAADYTVRLQLLTPEGGCCAWQSETAPGGANPTSQWVTGEVVVESYAIDLAPDLPPGRYPLQLELFLADSGRRLAAAIPDGVAADALYLRPIRVP